MLLKENNPNFPFWRQGKPQSGMHFSRWEKEEVRCSRKGWGAWGGVSDRHSFLKFSESIQKGHFFHRKGASVGPARTTAVINPFCSTAEALYLRDRTTQGHPLQSTYMSLPTTTELSAGGTFSPVNHLPLWQHPSLSMLQLHQPTFALCSCSSFLVLLR